MVTELGLLIRSLRASFSDDFVEDTSFVGETGFSLFGLVGDVEEFFKLLFLFELNRLPNFPKTGFLVASILAVSADWALD